MSSKPKIGIVGCGIISELLLSGAKLADVNICAVCDVDEEKAKAAAWPFGATVYTDFSRMLNESGIDGVIIALPSHLHYDAAIEALKCGKHVFCEKTLTNSVEKSRDLMAKALASGKVFQLGYMKRFCPSFVALKERFDAIEPLINATFKLTATNMPVLEGEKQTAGSWHSDPDKVGGGFLIHSGSHLVDLMLHFFGLPESVWGHIKRDINDNEYVNNFVFKMCSGLFVNMQLFGVRAQGFGYAGGLWEEKVEVTGVNGRLLAEDADWQGKIPSRAFVHLADGEGPKRLFTYWDSQWAGEIKAFSDGISQGKCLGSSVVDGYRVDYILSRLKRLEHEEGIITFDWDQESTR